MKKAKFIIYLHSEERLDDLKIDLSKISKNFRIERMCALQTQDNSYTTNNLYVVSIEDFKSDFDFYMHLAMVHGYSYVPID